MKKVFTLIAVTMITLASFGQAKNDTTAKAQPKPPAALKPVDLDTLIAVVFKPADFELFTKRLEQLIDSKEATRLMMEFIIQRAQQITQPANKPKQ